MLFMHWKISKTVNLLFFVFRIAACEQASTFYEYFISQADYFTLERSILTYTVSILYLILCMTSLTELY